MPELKLSDYEVLRSVRVVCHFTPENTSARIPTPQQDNGTNQQTTLLMQVRRTPVICVIGLVLAFLFLLTPLSAQFTTASLGGIVTDSSGGAVPGAQVTVHNADTGLTRTLTTGADGAYLFPLLPIGTYRLTVEKTGFSAYTQEGIMLSVNQVASQAVTLGVGAVNQQVTISADAGILPTQTATVADLVDERRIVALPPAAPD